MPGKWLFPAVCGKIGAFPVIIASRESEEEIALSRDAVTVLGGLEEIPTRKETRVRPVVGWVEENTPLEANTDEIAAIFTVPLAFFRDDQRLRTDIFTCHKGGIPVQHWVPAYQYGDYEIWGFTAAVLVRLMNRCFDTDIQRQHRAPEKIW